MVDRVLATPAALELIAELKAEYGPELMFHQSGGCCDNSAANCYLPSDLTIGAGDVTALAPRLVAGLEGR